MNKNKLLGIIKTKGRTVKDVVQSINNFENVSIRYSTFYIGLRDERPFRQSEILALSKTLGLSEDDIMSIFFGELVS